MTPNTLNFEVRELKFENRISRVMYAIEEGIISPEQVPTISDESLSNATDTVSVGIVESRMRKRKRIKDRKRSKLMKKLWKSKRKSFEKGIKKFHKSTKGKRMHQKVARNRKAGRYRNTNEAYTNLSSILTHLSIGLGYSEGINEEADSQLLFETGHEILSPLLLELSENMSNADYNVNQIMSPDGKFSEAGEFVDDVLGITAVLNKDYDDEDGESLGEELTGEDFVPTRREKGNINPDLGNGDGYKGEVGDGLNSDGYGSDGTGGVPPSDAAGGVSESITPEISQDGIDALSKIASGMEDAINESIEDKSTSEFEDIFETLEVPPESYSFVDTSTGKGKREIGLINESLNISSSSNVPNSVIAVIRGAAFFPNKVSGNKVEYSSDLWGGTLNKKPLVEMLETNRLMGTIGHDVELDDAGLRDGNLSHITSKLWVDPTTNVGMAEHLILDTDLGRTIATLYGAGSTLRVSTRARGRMYKSLNSRGNRVPDPDSFFLRGVDFTVNPGFLETGSQVAEFSN